MNEALLNAAAIAPFPKIPDSFKPLAEAFDVATPANVEEEEEVREYGKSPGHDSGESR